MSDDPDDKHEILFTARPPPGSDGADIYSASTVAGQAPADLLDLVRSAEEAATLPTTRRPASANKFHTAPKTEAEEFVDVDGDAVDAPPSLPPIRAADGDSDLEALSRDSEPPSEGERVSKVTAKNRLEDPSKALPAPSVGSSPSRTMHPAIGIAIMLALAIGFLALITR